jgi:hypothetical protein
MEDEIAGALMPSAFADHVRSNPSRSVAECLDDALLDPIHKIEIPDSYYDLDERYQDTRRTDPNAPTERPPTSFTINATTWRELGAATRLFDHIATDYDIFPMNVFIEKDVALVCCDT